MAHAADLRLLGHPVAPIQGEATTFELTPTSAAVYRVRWDLDGDGQFDDGDARTVTRTYAARGPVIVRMRARETKDSKDQNVTKTITVNGRAHRGLRLHPGGAGCR